LEGNSVKRVDKKILDSSLKELEESMQKQKIRENVEFPLEVFEILKKEFGDFKIIL